MTAEPQDTPGGVAATIVEDLFLTDAFLVKGRIANKYQRLTKMLEDSERVFVQVDEATMVPLRGGEVIRAPKMLINRNEIILAHELVDFAGDLKAKQLAANDKPVRIRAFYSGAIQIELAGQIEAAAYEPSHNRGRWYFIMQQPVIRGLSLDTPELRVLKAINYAIVRKNKLSYIYDFG